MKVVELLKIGKEMLKVLSRCDVMRDDWRYVGMVEEYQVMRGNGVKHTAAIGLLGESYGVSERTVERILKRLGREC